MYWYAGRYHSRQRIRKLRPAERTTFEQAKQDGYLVCTSRGSAELEKVRWHYYGALRKHHLTIRKQWRYGQLDLNLLPTDGFDAGILWDRRSGCVIPDEVMNEFHELRRNIEVSGSRRCGTAGWSPLGFFFELPIAHLEPLAQTVLARIAPPVKAHIAAQAAQLSTSLNY